MRGDCHGKSTDHHEAQLRSDKTGQRLGWLPVAAKHPEIIEQIAQDHASRIRHDLAEGSHDGNSRQYMHHSTVHGQRQASITKTYKNKLKNLRHAFDRGLAGYWKSPFEGHCLSPAHIADVVAA